MSLFSALAKGVWETMPVACMRAVEAESSQRHLSASLRELCQFLLSFPNIQMTEEECEALAVAAVSGHAEAEFMVGSVFDAAEETERARAWYFRSASRDYLPAMLQLCAVR
jgi:hypothetical protein